MKFEDVEKLFNDAVNFNRCTGMARMSWYNWKKQGYIPIRSQFLIQLRTNNNLIADFKHVPEGERNE